MEAHAQIHNFMIRYSTLNIEYFLETGMENIQLGILNVEVLKKTKLWTRD